MSSTAADFRNLTPLVLMAALKQAGTHVHQPILAFQLEFPADTLGTILLTLTRLQAIPEKTTIQDAAATATTASAIVIGEIPAGRLYELQRELPSSTRGEAILETSFDRYEIVAGQTPTRQRPSHHPSRRKQYLQNIGLTPAERSRIT